MKRLYTLLLCGLLIYAPAMLVFPQDTETSDTETPNLGNAAPKTRNMAVRALIASGEALFSNGLMLSYNLAVLRNKATWATPTAATIRDSFTKPWQWELTDGFKVNQFGHPYHGTMYFGAGRANGFGFYESIFFSSMGSFTWETLCESAKPSINDYIATSIGAAPLGEILYRLYLEACAAGVPSGVAALINPMAAFHRLVSRWKPPNEGRRLYQLQYYVGIGYVQNHFSLASEDFYNHQGPMGDLGINIVYGNPFQQTSTIPYEHFEASMGFGIDGVNYVGIRFISDGYLFSFSPVYTDTEKMSTGLSLHMDFVSQGKFDFFNGIIDQYSNALDWTVKYQHLFSSAAVFQLKFHAGVTFFGGSEYYANGSGEYPKGRELKTYGGGLNGKLFLALETSKLGKLETNLLCYTMWTYPGTSAVSKSNVFWLFVETTYSVYITKRMSVGVNDLFSLERGTYSNGFPNTFKYNNVLKLFVAWNF